MERDRSWKAERERLRKGIRGLLESRRLRKDGVEQ